MGTPDVDAVKCGPDHPWLAAGARRALLPLVAAWCARRGLHRVDSPYGKALVRRLARRLQTGETVHLIGVTAASHNAGLALVEASRDAGLRLACSLEEERFTGRKHEHRFPDQSVTRLREFLHQSGIRPFAVAGSWDYAAYLANSLADILAFAPTSFSAFSPRNVRQYQYFDPKQILQAPRRLSHAFGVDPHIVGLRHHDNHAVFSYAVSPFANGAQTTMVLVMDGQGDDASVSAYLARDGQITRLWRNDSLFDSVGGMYALLSSVLGGWTQLSSEGRFMGAAAWGDMDRASNPFYRRLRRLLVLGHGGQVQLNTGHANWQRDLSRPFTPALEQVLGPPIPWERLWNPDAVLDVRDVRHSPITQERVDRAAALQLLFEDAVIHVVEALIRASQGANHLVWTGGAALNCLCSLRLLEHFDEEWYTRNYGLARPLHLWVPPVPNDAGVAAGAACNLGWRALTALGIRPTAPRLEHAFYCGVRPCTQAEVIAALQADVEVDWLALGDAERAADLLASMVADNAIVGLFQGVAEMGPRALGHRSILANATNPAIREILNERVKYRESVRPLAPMVTLAAARRFFVLPAGADHGDEYGSCNYMTLTVRARPVARAVIPAVIHQDGTARTQIVRPHIDPVCYAYLKELGRLVGAEVSVNTSLNVAAPIAQTPAQAIDTLRRSRGMHALMFVAARDAFLCWHRPKAVRVAIERWLTRWRASARDARDS
jgi:carbamoyltransferase